MVAPIYVDGASQQRTHLAVENAYGVLPASPTWLRTPDMRLVPKPQFETEMVTGAGDELPSGVILLDDYTNVEATGKAGYTTIMYPLASMFGFPTDALVTGTTYDHTYTWDGRTPVIPASYSFHYGLPGRVDEVLGFLFNSLGMTVSRGGYDFTSGGFGKAITPSAAAMGGITNEVQTLTVTGSPTAFAPTIIFKGRSVAGASQASWTAAQMQTLLESLPTIGVGNVICGGGPLPGTPITVTFIGKLGGQDVPQLLTTGTTFTAGSSPAFTPSTTTPGADTSTALTNVPIAPLHFDAFIGDSWSEIQAESTKLLATYSIDLGWGEKWQRALPVNASKSSDSIYVGEDQEHTIALKMGADATARGIYTTARAGAKKYVRLHAKGPQTGDASNQYELVMDLALLITATDGYDSENGIHVLTWNAYQSTEQEGFALVQSIRQLALERLHVSGFPLALGSPSVFIRGRLTAGEHSLVVRV